MTGTSQDWLKYAKEDYESAELLAHAGKFNTACYHYQQAGEKAAAGLTDFATRTRYPGYDASISDVNDCREFCNEILQFVNSWFSTRETME